MVDRISKSNVKDIFESYLRAAGNAGYDTSEWMLKITAGPMIISAAKGQTGTDGFEPLPGFSSTTLGITYRDVYAALMTATRTLQALIEDRPEKQAASLWLYQVQGRNGTHYVDLYYDEKRDGSHSMMAESAVFVGSKKQARSIAMYLNIAIRTSPIEPHRVDNNVRYLANGS
jgi:hypothetical protein